MDINSKKKYSSGGTLNSYAPTIILAVVTLTSAGFLWWLISKLGNFPSFILPSPQDVWQRLVLAIQDGSLFRHSLFTLQEILSGLALGVGVATLLGYMLAKSPTFEKLVSPYIVASQSVPIVAIAPILIIWFGSGIFSKILICSLIVFFPVLVNTIVGLRSIPDELKDLMRSLKATRWQTIRCLEIPGALPVFLGGLRVGATLSVIGAVVGEFVGSDKGLGFLINIGRGQYDTALVFVSVFTLIIMAMSLYGIVVLLEKRLLSWQQSSNETILER